MRDNFFRGGHWGQCLDLVSHLCEHGDRILLVSGPAGIGKSYMLHVLQQEQASKFIISEQLASAYLDSDTIITEIETCLQNTNQDQIQKRVLLLIDDAQNLSLETVAVLLTLPHKYKQTLRLVLFATADLENKVLRSVIKDDFSEQVHIIELEPLTLAETESFLLHQWRLDHTTQDLPFEKAQIRRIFSLTGGIPAAVKRIAKDMQNDKQVKQLDASEGLSPVMVGVTVAFGILFCLLAFLWPSADDSILKRTEDTLVSTQDIDALDEDAQLIEPAITTPTVTTLEQPNLAPPDDMASVTTQHESVGVTQAAASEPQTTAPAKQTLNVEQESDEERIARLERKLQALQEQLSSEQATRSPLTKTNKKPRELKPLGKSTPKFNKQEQHILSLPGSNYTLQLVGARSEKKLTDFIKENKLSDQAHVYKTRYRGRPWYVIIYGNYSSKQEAQKALSKLSPGLKKYKPWARNFTHIQNAINKYAE